MACDSCMKSHDFLSVYQLRTQPVKMLKEDTATIVTVTDSPGKEDKLTTTDCTTDGKAGTQATDDEVDKNGTDENLCGLARRRLLLGNCGSGEACDSKQQGAGFFEENWRTQLCGCDSCKVRVMIE